VADQYADAVVVAAGSSRRMGGADKLEAPILGSSLLRLAVESMAAAQSIRRVVLVVAPQKVDRMRSVGWLLESKLTVVAGGDRRTDSVLAGLRATDADVVLVHDGARPLASPALTDSVAGAAARHGAAVPVIPVVDSLKRASNGRLAGGVDRDGFVRAQTPQGARRTLLLDAYAAAGGADFSDEAALLDSHGVPVATVPGEAFNIKVTEPADLDLVRAIATARAGHAESRVGFGQDSHQFGPGDGLWLGGVLFEGWPRLHGHSDGDVALHALATALLAASGLGDLGRLFPDSDRSTLGAPSARLLADAIDRTREAGWQAASVQVSLVGARPRLGAERLERIRARIAELTAVGQESVAVVASSGNLSGDEGAGRAISASAVVTMVRS
jgi:2-C-methyl-D-erythritol 4-phosphate cytidylyltransferase / 2-C-methyl-D-erythritol 2,4-cyclodiphosphate synthase